MESLPLTSTESKKRAYDQLENPSEQRLTRHIGVSMSESFDAAATVRTGKGKDGHIEISPSPQPHLVRASPILALSTSSRNREWIPSRRMTAAPVEGKSVSLVVHTAFGAEEDEPHFPPPVREIAIPSTSSSDHTPGSPAQLSVDYESLYLSTQKEKHDLRIQLDRFQEENRLLKRQLIEWQRRVYCRMRTRPSRNSSWTVPR